MERRALYVMPYPTCCTQSDKISHIDIQDDHIDTVISHIISQYPISISRMTHIDNDIDIRIDIPYRYSISISRSYLVTLPIPHVVLPKRPPQLAHHHFPRNQLGRQMWSPTRNCTAWPWMEEAGFAIEHLFGPAVDSLGRRGSFITAARNGKEIEHDGVALNPKP